MRAQALVEQRVAARVERRAERGERRADLRRVGDVNDVGRDQQAEPDAEAGAVRDGERRSGKRRHASQQRGDEPAEVPEDVVVARVDTRDVAPRAERAPLAAENQRSNAGCFGLGVRGRQLVERTLVERIELRGCVEHDVGDVALDGEVDHGAILPGKDQTS